MSQFRPFVKYIPNLFFLGGVGILTVITVSYSRDYFRAKLVDEEIIKLENELVLLQEKNVELNKLIEYLDSDAYAEKKARTELGLKKAGEGVVIISEEATSAEVKQMQDYQDNLPNYLKWWRYFFWYE